MDKKKKIDIIIGSIAIFLNFIGLTCMLFNGTFINIFKNVPYFIGSTLLIYIGLFLIFRKNISQTSQGIEKRKYKGITIQKKYAYIAILLLLIIFIILLVFFYNNKINTLNNIILQKNRFINNFSSKVICFSNDSKYHKIDCKHHSYSTAILTTEEKALNSGFRPCSICFKN